MRLTPVFMAAQGVPVYTLPGSGVLTTWIYGPAPLWLWSPCVFARDAISALLIGGAINTALTLAAITLTCLLWPCAGATRPIRLLAVALACALWPEASWRFLQADNVVIACGLLANLALASAAANQRWTSWIAAAATALALASKQNAVGLLAGQLLWLWQARGGRAAADHAVRTMAIGGLLAAVAAMQFGLRELWFGVITVPSRLPWADDLAQRARFILPFVVQQWVVPGALLWIFGRRLLALSPALGLVIACWGATLPLGVAGAFSTGGTVNHLHGLQLLIPAALVALLAWASAHLPRLLALGSLLACAIVAGQISQAASVPLRPATVREELAIHLARRSPGAVWLPWAPLVTYFGEGRFDHVEDGIYVRFITGYSVPLTQMREHLPPRFSSMILPAGNADWGQAIKFAPASSKMWEIGGWRIVQWTPEPVPR